MHQAITAVHDMVAKPTPAVLAARPTQCRLCLFRLVRQQQPARALRYEDLHHGPMQDSV